jgi:excisionase family DNA binding protein
MGDTVESLDIRKAADLLSLKPPTIRKLILRRGIPFYRLGRRVVFDRDELIELRNERRVAPITNSAKASA